MRRLSSPFRVGGKLHVPLVVLFCCVNGLVAFNAWLHDPRVGYDAHHHLGYVEALSHARWVTPEDSREFFSPPLPYVFPALLMAATGMDVVAAARYALWLNVLASLGVTWSLLRSCELASSRVELRLGALAALGILPVYYRTFAFVRGEPLMLLFLALSLHRVMLLFVRHRLSRRNTVILGASLGAALLSRQWAILVFPALALAAAGEWRGHPALRGAIARSFAASLVIAFLTCGWFYVGLRVAYGAFTAFNRPPAPAFRLSNQPAEFYFGKDYARLFSHPVRPAFPNQLPPILYSETWGDYWGYFFIHGIDTREPADRRLVGRVIEDTLALEGGRPDWLITNYESGGRWLGRINRVALLPSLFFLAALVHAVARLFSSRKGDAESASLSRISLVAIAVTMLGYVWFLILYPASANGDTIKATYVLQAFLFLAILAGAALDRIARRSVLAYRLLAAAWVVFFLHSLPVMVTHYPSHPVPW